VESAAILVILAYAAFLFNWQISLLLITTIPMQAYVMHVEFPKIAHAASVKDYRIKVFLSTAQEAFEKILSARLIHIGAFMKERIMGRGGEYKRAASRLKGAQLKMDYRTSLVETFGVMAVVMMGALYLRGGRLDSLGQVLALYRVAQQVNEKTGKLIQQARCLRISADSLSAVCGLINQRGPAPSEDGAIALNNYDVEFKGVRFRYGDRDEADQGGRGGDVHGAGNVRRDVLCGVDLLVEEGAKVVVVGSSGAGKSTLLKVMTKLLEHRSGEITVGGLPFNRVDQSSVYSGQPQASFLFDLSIRDNIRVGAPESTTDQDVEEAAIAASIIGTPDQAWMLPRGLDTPAGIEGSNLNVGAQQRVLLARTLCRNKPIILLDEPMSGQDVGNKLRIVKALMKKTWVDGVGNAHPCTVIVVSHDINTCLAFDRVAYLENGQIVEYGAHETLLEDQGRYWRFVQQAEAISLDASGAASITPGGLAQCCWILALAGDEILEEVVGAFVSRTLSAGDTLCEQGVPCDAFYIVAQGTVGEYRATPGKDSPVPRPDAPRSKVREICAGESYGDSALYADLTESEADDYYPSTCVAASPVVVLMLRGDAFAKLCQGNLQLAELVRQLVGKVNKVRAQGALRKMWPLLHLSDARVEKLGSMLRPQAYPPGYALCTRTAPCSGAFYVIEGEVFVTCQSKRGLDASPYTRIVGESEIFGLSALLDHVDPQVVEAKVITPSVLLVLDRTLWEQLLEELPYRICIHRVLNQVNNNLTADALARHWPFAALPAGVLEGIAEVFRPSVFSPELGLTELVGQINGVDCGFVVVHGEVTLQLEDAAGNPTQRVYFPGEMCNHAGMLGVRTSMRITRVFVTEAALVLCAKVGEQG